MNLGQLRQSLTRMIGDYALVGQDTTDPSNVVPDYDTDGAAHEGELNELINNAVRTVVDKLPALFDQESYLCRLTTGDYRIQVPNLRKLDRAEVWQTDQYRYELLKTSMRTLRQEYPSDWDTMDGGEPEYIAPGQLLSRQRNLTPANFEEVLGDVTIPGGYCAGSCSPLADGSGVTFAAGVFSSLVYYLVSTGTHAASSFTGPFTLSFRMRVSGSPEVVDLHIKYRDTSNGTWVELGPISEPGDYSFNIPIDGVGQLFFQPGSDGTDQTAIITLDRLELRQTGTDSTFTSSHLDHFILMPPADGSYDIRVWGWFYPDPLVNLFDRNEVTDKFHKLVRLLAATEWATDRGHEGLTNHWGTQANRELMERLRDIGARQLAEIENADGQLDWQD